MRNNNLDLRPQFEDLQMIAKEQGITIASIEQQLDYSNSYINHCESGAQYITFNYLVSYADAVGVDVTIQLKPRVHWFVRLLNKLF